MFLKVLNIYLGMKEDEEDGGIGVDFDQCTEEFQFYTSCLEDRGDGNVSRADSAVCLNSARDPFPAETQKFNSSRRNHHVRIFHEAHVKRCQRYREEMETQRNGTDSYLLTQQRLSIHLIDFVDLPLKVSLFGSLRKKKTKLSEKHATPNMDGSSKQPTLLNDAKWAGSQR